MRGRIFASLDRLSPQSALIDDTRGAVSYGVLLAQAAEIGALIESRLVVAIVCSNSFDCLAGYLGLMRAGAVVLLLHHSVKRDHLADIIANFGVSHVYAPAAMDCPGSIRQEFGAYVFRDIADAPIVDIHPDLALLLTTSGTTGTRSFVRLSYDNLDANALSIANYLELTETDRAITTMPMSYSYGLSILHSHWAVGASVIMTEATLMSPAFWQQIKTHCATNFGGVPFVYEMLKKLKFDAMDVPSLRLLTQAGGKMPLELARFFAQTCQDKNIRFYMMYGQTEATARISYLPWQHALSKTGSIGIAIPGGELALEEDELVYRGPNVCLGYARGWGDLSRGDENKGCLHTGDLARRDEHGDLYIVGRKKRFLKVFGHRVDLEQMEHLLKAKGYDCVCAGRDDKLSVFVVGEADLTAVRKAVAESSSISAQGYDVKMISAIPRTESGKVDYAALPMGVP